MDERYVPPLIASGDFANHYLFYHSFKKHHDHGFLCQKAKTHILRWLRLSDDEYINDPRYLHVSYFEALLRTLHVLKEPTDSTK